MATNNQITANRRNARKSTGPRKTAGKARSGGNVLKHGLTATRVVLFDEDPAAFDALRESLHVYFQPTNPVAEQLVEHVAASIWRLRRVPEIEAGIFAHFRLLQECRQAEKRAAAQVDEPFPHNPFSFVRDEKTHAAAERDRKRAETKLQTNQPVMGEVFASAERSAISLVRIAGAIEGSMYRAIRELERMKPERPDPLNDNSVIDAEVDEE